MKKLLCFIGLAAFASIEAKEYWQCDSLGKLNCAQNQTCCRSKTNSSGWECFNSIRAVCCSNGINSCPEGTICDLTNKTCNKKTLSFLTAEANTEPLPSVASSNTPCPVISAELFLEGFFGGFDLFAHVSDGNTCLTNKDFVNYIADVLNRLKNVPLDANLPKFVEELAKDFIVHSDLLVSEAVQCKQLGANAKVVLESLRQKVMQADYLKKLSMHLVLHLNQIREMTEKLTPLAQAGEFEMLGRTSGELAKFVFFWDLTEDKN